VAGFDIGGPEPSDSATNSVTATGRRVGGASPRGSRVQETPKMDILNKKKYFLPLANFNLLGQFTKTSGAVVLRSVVFNGKL